MSLEDKIRAQLPITRLISAYMPLSLSQWIIRKTVSRAKLPAGFTQEPVLADGVLCEWLIPENSPQDQVLLYLHGGGFIYGLTSIHIEMVAYIAQQMGMRVLMVDYRLAPQHPFPAGLDDCVSAYRWLLKQGISAGNIVIAGDSAGGNFTITTLMKLRDEGDPLPSASACLSPVIDLSKDEGTFRQQYDAILHPRATKFMRQSYIGNDKANNPLISPAYGDWSGLPPMLIHAGADEVLCEDAKRSEELAKQAGVEVQLEIFPRMWHVWQLYLELPQTIQSLNTIATFLKSHVNKQLA